MEDKEMLNQAVSDALINRMRLSAAEADLYQAILYLEVLLDPEQNKDERLIRLIRGFIDLQKNLTDKMRTA